MLASAFILGLLGSLHCMGMCGPIVFMLPVDQTNTYKKLSQITLYHIGRLLSYSIIGLAFGLVGKSLYIFGLQQQLSIIIGVLMILFVILPQNKLSRLSITKPIYKIIGKVKSSMGSAFKKKTADTFLTIGFLNGFLPCGLVYVAVFGAIATGHILESGLYMLLFGLGTVPLMTTAVYVGKFLNGTLKQQIKKAIPIVVVVIGALFILRGLGLGIPYISPGSIVEMASGSLECH